MYDRSIWFEEVDLAFHKLITKEFGNIIKKVTFVSPDTGFKVEDFPCVTIQPLYSKEDLKRKGAEGVNVRIGLSNDKLNSFSEKEAIPYKLTYQIDFYSRKQSDMHKMTRVWLGKHRIYDLLECIDPEGTIRPSFMRITDSVMNVPVKEGKEKLYRTIFTYEVWVELDLGEVIITPTVQQVVIREKGGNNV